MVKGIAMVTKHMKAKKDGVSSGVHVRESYIHISNVKRIT